MRDRRWACQPGHLVRSGVLRCHRRLIYRSCGDWTSDFATSAAARLHPVPGTRRIGSSNLAASGGASILRRVSTVCPITSIPTTTKHVIADCAGREVVVLEGVKGGMTSDIDGHNLPVSQLPMACPQGCLELKSLSLRERRWTIEIHP